MKIRTLLFVATSLLALSGVCEEVETVKVRGKGIGTDRTEALKDAYRDAVEHAVGLYVDAEQMVENEELVKDQILTQSNAYIERYKIAKEGISENGLITITILADVRKRDLTRKIRNVVTTQMIDLSDVSRNLHARIITDFKANDDALSIIRNELKDLQPLKQLMKLTLASRQPVVESVKEDSSLARLWYPIRVEVDANKYYKEFAPRWKRILEQIKVEPAKRLDLKNNMSYVKTYNAVVDKKFGTARKGIEGIMTRCDEANSREETWAGPLERYGLALNEEYQGMAFFETRVLGKSFVLHGLNAAPAYPAYFAKCALEDKPRAFGIGLIERAFIESQYSYGLIKLVDGSCKFCVGLVTKSNGQSLTGSWYKIPASCTEEIIKWQHQTACGTTERYDYRKTVPEVEFSLRFFDAESNEIASQSFLLRSHDVLNIGCGRLAEPEHLNHKMVGRFWLITPLVGGFAKSYVKWISIDIPKDDVAKIATASISVEE